MPEQLTVSLAPLTPDQAVAALPKVKPAGVAKLEAKEARAKKPALVRKRKGK